MHEKNLYKAMGWIAWGSVVGSISLDELGIPLSLGWLSYLFFLIALPTLAHYAPSILSLRPFAMLLMLYHIAYWVTVDLLHLVNVDSLQSPWMLAQIIFLIITMYFFFQLLTYLSNIAEQFALKQAKSLVSARNLYVASFAVFFLLISLPESMLISFPIIPLIVGIMLAVALIWILYLLFSMRKSLKDVPFTE